MRNLLVLVLLFVALAATAQRIKGFVTVKSEPTGAKVLVDGKPTGMKTPAQKPLEVGKHTITLQHELYEDETISFTITEGQTKNLFVKFTRPFFGTLKLQTTDGAEIYINGQKAGEGHLTKKLKVGSYSIEIKKEGYFPERFTQNITESESSLLVKKILKVKKGVLQLTTKPFEASIKINGKTIGKTPLVRRLPIGNYTVEITKDGYRPHSETFTILQKQTLEKSITLVGDNTFKKIFGGIGIDFINSIVQTTDGGFVAAGWTESKGAGKNDMWVLKLDSSGSKVWEKTFGGVNDDKAHSIVQTTDRGFAVAGYTWSGGMDEADMWVLKLDNSGNKTWDKTFGGGGSDFANSIVQTTDGGFVVAGYTKSKSKGAGQLDMLVLKLDKNGNL